VTAAGLALAASFALLAIVPLRSFREFAFVMTVGVLVDTFIVRSMLVPALTSLFGEAAWWPGRRVRPAGEADLVERVSARAGVGSAQAETATRATLCTLAERITKRETRALATGLPRRLAGQVRGAARAPERFGADEFVRRVSEREGVPEAEARAHARAVLTTLEAASADGLAYVRAQLSGDYGAFFSDQPAGSPGGDGPGEPVPPDDEPRVRRETAEPAATDRSARRD
jgi:RND superfamily putative drug exporter